MSLTATGKGLLLRFRDVEVFLLFTKENNHIIIYLAYGGNKPLTVR